MAKARRKKTTSIFSKNFNKVLDERQIPLKVAAELAGISYSTACDWKNGAIPHDLEAVARFCKKINCSFEWILVGTESNKQIQTVPLSEQYDEVDVGLSGLFKLSAVKLVKKENEE